MRAASGRGMLPSSSPNRCPHRARSAASQLRCLLCNATSNALVPLSSVTSMCMPLSSSKRMITISIVRSEHQGVGATDILRFQSRALVQQQLHNSFVPCAVARSRRVMPRLSLSRYWPVLQQRYDDIPVSAGGCCVQGGATRRIRLIHVGLRTQQLQQQILLALAGQSTSPWPRGQSQTRRVYRPGRQRQFDKSGPNDPRCPVSLSSLSFFIHHLPSLYDVMPSRFPRR